MLCGKVHTYAEANQDPHGNEHPIVDGKSGHQGTHGDQDPVAEKNDLAAKLVGQATYQQQRQHPSNENQRRWQAGVHGFVTHQVELQSTGRR